MLLVCLVDAEREPITHFIVYIEDETQGMLYPMQSKLK